MQKNNLVLFCIIITHFAFAQQSDTTIIHKRIKVGKRQIDSLFVKAEIKFFQFQTGNKMSNEQVSMQSSYILPPVAYIKAYRAPVNFNQLYNARIENSMKDLDNKETDTVRIQVKVLDNGRAYYKDVNPLLMIKGMPAYYDEKMDGYKLDPIHLSCMNVLKEIDEWRPAYSVTEKREQYKKRTVIKPKKKKLSAVGILTIVFSKTSFDD
jgi:hypothetical protein